MKYFTVKNLFKILTDLKFALAVLGTIAIASSFGSFIEQDESISFYQENYPTETPIYGFITWNFIIFFGLDHVYTTFWFLLLLIILGISLIGCTFTRQFPLLINSKEYFFRKQSLSFINLPFSIKLKNFFYIKEGILLKIQSLNFYVYQNGNFIYGYKGLIGRISPILVHLSLIIILTGSAFGAFKNFKAQEILPKGEIFHIQNPIRIGSLTSLPTITTRVNDFWVEYKNNKIRQFYSNLSILDSMGNEIKQQTISVNNPLRYKQVDIYQSDWNLVGIRIQKKNDQKIYEFPCFSLKNNSKSWVTWINISMNNKPITLVFDQMQNSFLTYDETGNFLNIYSLGDLIENEFSVIDILPSTGLLIKYDPSIPIIYFGFALLMFTTSLSYLPYTQFWLFENTRNIWVGSLTNRGKIQLEIEFENLIRSVENKISKLVYIS